MPSRSLITWNSHAARELDEIEAADTAVGGNAPGRRYATQQVNYAYAVLLSSQFQRFCRDLHSEGVDHISKTIAPGPVRNLFRTQLTYARKLDTANPNPGNIGNDFGRLGLNFWPSVIAANARVLQARLALELLNKWRNAIAHMDFDPSVLGGTVKLRLASVRQWRSACTALAKQFDFTVGQYVATITGRSPW